MDTLELLPSLAQGELAETSAPELVAAVFRSRASGTLWLETPDGTEIRVFFRAGEMCGATAFQGVQTLAHVLLAHDLVDALAIDSSREEAVKSGKRHGEVLVARGLVTKEQLRRAGGAAHGESPHAPRPDAGQVRLARLGAAAGVGARSGGRSDRLPRRGAGARAARAAPREGPLLAGRGLGPPQAGGRGEVRAPAVFGRGSRRAPRAVRAAGGVARPPGERSGLGTDQE